ncbi:unnamed protein product [Meloidogyne enterolobii]|uniref:Uncharacterized protein n=1 Tax=Meloidogyne enterolobii TaxID=390850 RepID=A0ACB0ZYH3_MELEN
MDQKRSFIYFIEAQTLGCLFGCVVQGILPKKLLGCSQAKSLIGCSQATTFFFSICFSSFKAKDSSK